MRVRIYLFSVVHSLFCSPEKSNKNTEQKRSQKKKMETLNSSFSFFAFQERRRERRACSFLQLERERAKEDEDEGLRLRWPPPKRGVGRCFAFVFFESSFSFFRRRKIFQSIFFFKEEEAFERRRSKFPMWEPRRERLRGETECEHDDACILRRRRGNEKKKPSDRLPVDRESKLMGFETVRGKSPRGWRGVVARLRARRLLVRAENILRLPSGEMFTNERESS